MSEKATRRSLNTWQRIHLHPRGEGKWAHSDEIPDPSLWIYRATTKGMLVKYFRLSVEVGRLPSLVGREYFRSKVTSQGYTFEDAVVFVHDMEASLEKLGPFSQQVILWRVLHDYSADETAKLLGCGRQTVSRRLNQALDRLSEILLLGGLIRGYGSKN
jgi:RNA polymerase sigma factor (sigma-70 family)